MKTGKDRHNGCKYCGKQRTTMQTFYMCSRCHQNSTREARKAHYARRYTANCIRLFGLGLNTAEIAVKINKSEAFVYNAMHNRSVHGSIVQLTHGIGEDGGLTTKEDYHVEQLT